MDKYKLTFVNSQIRVEDTQLTFSIGKIKSRVPSVLYFKFYGYDVRKNLIEEYTSNKWVIDTNYSLQYETFTITNPTQIDNFTIEMYLYNINSENPLYFNHIQLNSGAYKDYHQPNEAISNVEIGFSRNSYVNLYGTTDEYLQIIRPNQDTFSTIELTPAQTTILAPHLPNETSYDDPVALFYEYMYQTEQKIGVDK